MRVTKSDLLRVAKKAGGGTSGETFTAVEKAKLGNIENYAEVNNISDANVAELTSGGETAVHSHEAATHNHNLADLSEKSYNSLTGKPTIPDELSDLSDDAGHRTVSDAEKATWNDKQEAMGEDDNYVTDAEKNVIGNTSGTNTGDQDISGIGTNATAIGLNTTHRGSNGSEHADVASNTGARHTSGNDTALGAQSQNLNMNTHKIAGLVDPTSDQEAATRKYVDDTITAIGAGDVAGPSSAVDENIVTFDGATGKIIQDGGQTISEIIEAAVAASLAAQYEVGDILTNISGTNPGTKYGGTWESFGAGRVLVGLDSGDTDFDTAEETLGAKTHALTSAQNGPHSPGLNVRRGNDAPSTSATILGLPLTSSSNTPRGANTAAVQNSGTGTAHNNIQPSIVVYMWKRTA